MSDSRKFWPYKERRSETEGTTDQKLKGESGFCVSSAFPTRVFTIFLSTFVVLEKMSFYIYKRLGFNGVVPSQSCCNVQTSMKFEFLAIIMIWCLIFTKSLQPLLTLCQTTLKLHVHQLLSKPFLGQTNEHTQQTQSWRKSNWARGETRGNLSNSTTISILASLSDKLDVTMTVSRTGEVPIKNLINSNSFLIPETSVILTVSSLGSLYSK